MLPKKARLRRSYDIRRVLKHGRIVYGPDFKIKYCQNRFTGPRFVFIVSNKVSKKATVRNRIRRQLSSIILQNLDKIEKNYDMIILVESAMVQKKYSVICKNIETTLKQAKVL